MTNKFRVLSACARRTVARQNYEMLPSQRNGAARCIQAYTKRAVLTLQLAAMKEAFLILSLEVKDPQNMPKLTDMNYRNKARLKELYIATLAMTTHAYVENRHALADSDSDKNTQADSQQKKDAQGTENDRNIAPAAVKRDQNEQRNSNSNSVLAGGTMAIRERPSGSDQTGEKVVGLDVHPKEGVCVCVCVCVYVCLYGYNGD